ncbi:stage II sporulation protein R [Pseudalkalibacillus berkeleyi]|uniref:Stage II sporulation protein R n=1 Tax=Pseudalkalibacillus berkeleyi TaxID=1069813 RepID=A0ABS9H4U4_9BACL|nr:stage II sporulation protein R [Pseudalkalibacillus berkeleyi]MCF6138918.1 stage II sporulation protein R [Pseudalkalibacillus berkeleyi]
MKRKTIVLILLSLMVMVVFYETQIKVANASFNDIPQERIPEESIRLRILANSDSSADQELKRSIRDEVNQQITNWVFGIESLDEARTIIKRELPTIKKIVQQSLKQSGIQETFTVDFGNVAFPTKMYGEFVYPAGEYEAVLISIGEGTGSNWWCVLFPPLCFLDFDNGDAVEPENGEKVEATNATAEEPEVKFFVFELFEKIAGSLGNLFA